MAIDGKGVRAAVAAMTLTAGMTALPSKTATPEQDTPPKMTWVCTPEDAKPVGKVKAVIDRLLKRQEAQKLSCRWELDVQYTKEQAAAIVAQFRSLKTQVVQAQLGVFDRARTPVDVCVTNREWMNAHDESIAKLWKYLVEQRTEWSQGIVTKMKALAALGSGIPGAPKTDDEIIALITQKLPGAKRSACGILFRALVLPFTNRLATAQGLGEGLLRDAYTHIEKAVAGSELPKNEVIVAADAFTKAFLGAQKTKK